MNVVFAKSSGACSGTLLECRLRNDPGILNMNLTRYKEHLFRLREVCVWRERQNRSFLSIDFRVYILK